MTPFRWFLLLAAVNACLAYGPEDGDWTWALGLLVALVATAAWSGDLGGRSRASVRIADPPGWVTGVLGIAAILVYFHDLSGFTVWPLYDEAVTGLYALDNLHGWDGRFHYYFSALPPLSIWIQAVFFKALGPGLPALRLMPAVLAVVTLVLASAASRRFFRPWEALLMTVLLGSGYRLLLSGRIADFCIVVMLWIFLSLAVVGWTASGERPVSRGKAVFLGVTLGAGFYTFFTWPVVALAILLVLAALRRSRPGRDPRFWAWTLGSMFLTAAPWVGSVLGGSLHGYVLQRLDLSLSPDAWLERWRVVSRHFWTSDDAFARGPFFGGMLNPLEASWVLLGVATLWKEDRRKWVPWLLGLSLLLLAPALLSSPLHHTRSLQWTPLLLFAAFHGLRRMMRASAHPWRLAGILLALSLILNLYHLGWRARPWFDDPSLWGQHRNVEQYEAYRVLDRERKENGVGLVFLRLNSGGYDLPDYNASLEVAVYSWNGLADPGIDPREARWGALYVDEHHREYLTRKVPGIRWHVLGPADPDRRFTHVLGIFPLDSVPGTTLQDWVLAERVLERVYRQGMDDPGVFNKPSMEDLLPPWILEQKPLFGRDPFLRTVFLERVMVATMYSGNAIPLERMVSDTLKSEYPSPFILRKAREALGSGKGPKVAVGRE